MPRLLVLRGDSLEQELHVAAETIRIGRGQDNELVLEDPGKSVSRDHAEIRCEGGRFVLYDLGSQNGVWVSGTRVPFVVLDHDVVANIGPFRLMLDQHGVVDPPVRRSQPTESGTRYGGATKPQAPIRPPADPPAPATGSWLNEHGKWIAAGAATLLLGGIGFGLTRALRSNDEAAIPPRLEKAAALISAGACAEAIEELQPILAADPADAAAQGLKTQADACAPQAGRTPAAMTGEQIAAHLTAARRQIDGRNCAAALTEHIRPVLEAEPSNAEALALSAAASQCPPPPQGREPPRAPAARPPAPAAVVAQPSTGCPATPARVLPPAEGGLPLRDPCESPGGYAARVRAMQDRYDQAVAAVTAGAHQRAANLFDGILREAGAQYRDVSTRLAQAVYASAQDDEKKEDFERAQAGYRRAHDLDPTITVSADLARLTARRLEIGGKACELAKGAYAYSKTQEAFRQYEIVVKTLPPDHPCVATAKERFPDLRK